ncbi:MAG: alpha/beta hydrolase [Candidatus Eremiobacteraeota bacterium]|nr:alpha/beta hydrolase [Candidatus Eremiobacteraeota bacterium]
MHYVEQGEGPLVVLLHGWPESWYSWRHQIPALAAAGFRVVAPDQRGYGQTDRPEAIEAYNILNLVGDVVGLVRALGEERAVVVGHDWGAIVAAPCALLRHDMFRAVGLMSVPYLMRRPLRPAVAFALATQEKHFYQDYFQQPGKAEREFEEDVRKTILGVLYSGSGGAVLPKSAYRFDKTTRMVDNLTIPDELPAWLEERDVEFFVNEFTRAGFRGGINWYRNFDRNWELTPFLDGAKIVQPALFIAGERDGVLKMAAEEYKNLALNVPGLRVQHLVAGAGHWAEQERPDEVNGVLIDFLRGL